jgi:two-component system sensor histidine kinase ArlS
MKIRNRILIYFASTTILVSGVAMILIYLVFSEYREEQFQQLQNRKILQNIRLLEKFDKESAIIANLLDAQDINDFYDEKLFIYDGNKELLFASLDSLDVEKSAKVLTALSPSTTWIETKEGEYDLIGIYTQFEGNEYYAISKAYDEFGIAKLTFLRSILFLIFLFISITVTLLSFYMSKKIASPITALAKKLNKYNFGQNNLQAIEENSEYFEVNFLIKKFNQLAKRTNTAFAFQKHSIQHISHQLKTPLSVIVSELERIKLNAEHANLKEELEQLIIKAQSLGQVVNALLQITKVETSKHLNFNQFRIDEMLFDIVQEMQVIAPNFRFEISFSDEEIKEELLLIDGHENLIKQAFYNLLHNCTKFSTNQTATIQIIAVNKQQLKIEISNIGETLIEAEEKFLFHHFFRGNNSQKSEGFGLGLVLTKKIFDLHKIAISYLKTNEKTNVFCVLFPVKLKSNT